MPSNADIYQRVTDIIIESLEKGVVPWNKPWTSMGSGLHMNMVTKKPYRGINQFLCEIQATINGYEHPLWLSMKQVGSKGGKVRKGEKGTLITFWKIMRIKSDEFDAKGKPIIKTIPLLKYYYVWNVAQCDGLKLPEAKELPEFNPIEQAQAVLDNMQNRPVLNHGGDRAFYRPSTDEVTLPKPEQFESPESYYNTGYHEFVHSTGHESRTGRVTEWTGFGSDPYANEELVAELGAAMLCGTVGISSTHEQSASYISSWIARFKNDPKLIVQAAGKSQKACDYILGIPSFEEAEAAKEVANA